MPFSQIICGGMSMAFKLFRKNCCGLDVHKTWIYACIGITDTNSRTEYKQARFSSFSKGLQELSDWLAKYSCTEVCMESSGNTGSLSLIFLRKPAGLLLLIPNIRNLRKATKPTVKTLNGFATCLCVTRLNQGQHRTKSTN